MSKLETRWVPCDKSPLFTKARVVPFAIRSKYGQALEKLVKEDIIEKVEHYEWASPTILTVKANGNLRICGDNSVTINKFSVLEEYPIQTLEELLSTLSGGFHQNITLKNYQEN